MINGIKFYREKKGIRKSDLARLSGVGQQQLGRLEDGKRTLTYEWAEKIAPVLDCTAHDLMFPEMAQIDTERFSAVYDIATAPTDDGMPERPTLAFDNGFLAHFLPKATGRNLRLMMVEGTQANGIVTKGDAVVLDIDDNRPTRPGLYALEIAGVIQWRYLSPTTTGKIQVHSESPSVPNETVTAEELTVIGRGRLRISTL